MYWCRIGSVPGQPGQQFIRPAAVIAQQHHVASGGKRSPGAGSDAAGSFGAFHRKVIAENDAVKPQLFTQVSQPDRGKAGRPRIDFRIDHMRRHHCRQTGRHHAPKRQQIRVFHRRQRSIIDRDFVVRIGRDMAVPGKMLAARRQAAIGKALLQTCRQRGDRFGIAMKCAVTNHAAGTVVEIKHRRETQIDTTCLEFGCQHEPAGACGLERVVFARIPQATECPHRRNRCEAVAEALYPPAFMIDRDQQPRRAQCVNRGG